MKYIIKKIVVFTITVGLCGVLFTPFAHAEAPAGGDPVAPPSGQSETQSEVQSETPSYGGFTAYEPLAPLPLNADGSTPTELSKYLPAMFQFLIGIAGVLAVVMIVIGGIQYMSTDAVYGKSEGKEKITQALGGLLLAIIAWLILYTINPEILNTTLGGQNVKKSSSTASEEQAPHTAKVAYHIVNTYGPQTKECKSTYPSAEACQQSLSSLESSYPNPPYANVSVGCEKECVPTPPPPPYSLKITYKIEGETGGADKVACYPYPSPAGCQLAWQNFNGSQQPTWVISGKICTTECVEQ